MVHVEISASKVGSHKGAIFGSLAGSWSGNNGGLYASPLSPGKPSGSGGSSGSGGVSTQQLDPGFRGYRLYTLLDPAGAVFAEILVARTDYAAGALNYSANTEYWSVTAPSPGINALSISMEDRDWPSDGGAVPSFPVSGALSTFRMPVTVTWRQSRSDPANVHFHTDTNRIACIQWNLTYGTDGRWGGNLTWFQSVAKGDKPTALVLPKGGSLAYSREAVSEPEKSAWFSTEVTPSQ